MKKIRINLFGEPTDVLELYKTDVTNEHSCADHEYERIVFYKNQLLLVNSVEYKNNPENNNSIVVETIVEDCILRDAEALLR